MPAYLIAPWVRADFQQWKNLTRPQYLISVTEDTVIFSRREVIAHIYILKEGKVALSAWSRHGSEHVFMLAESGGVFGEQTLFTGDIQLYDAIAKTDCLLYRIPVSVAEKEIRSDPELAVNMLKMASQKLAMLEIQIIDLAFGTVRQRIASELLFQASIYGRVTSRGILIDQEIRQKDIYNRVNTSRVSVSKILREFTDAGYIAKNQKYYTILDEKALQRIIEA